MSKPWKNPPRPIGLAEVALHNKRRDCWIAVDGQVYDITRYLAKHPGGDIIMKGAGMDATRLFNEASKYGHQHSEGAVALLHRYHIGPLADEA